MTLTPQTLILLSLGLPLLACIACLLFARQQNLRDGLTFLAAIALFAVVVNILQVFESGTAVEASWWSFAPGIEIAFKI